MKYNTKSQDAVSPVVGVMLMLVVTIVIAAVVSAFAGGLVTSTEPTQTVVFTADYSQANGLTLSCSGSTSA
nr:type IV pilin [uncultured Methanocorpusculum sp.]